MRRLKRALIIAACSAGGLFLVVAGVGVQFLLRTPTAHWPGPRISDALPLEELAGFDRIPLVVYLLAWAAVALSLGLLVRRLRVERLTAGVVLFLAVGVELLLIDTFSLYLVRQIPAGQAL